MTLNQMHELIMTEERKLHIKKRHNGNPGDCYHAPEQIVSLKPPTSGGVRHASFNAGVEAAIAVVKRMRLKDEFSDNAEVIEEIRNVNIVE